MRIAPAITLSSEERTRLESQARSRSLPVRVAERARIVLFAAAGLQDQEIAARWPLRRRKFPVGAGVFWRWAWPGLQKDAHRPGRKPTIGARLTKRVVTMTTRQRPGNATHWSTRTMAAAVGISEASVRRIWRAHGLKPHRVEAFKISNDPRSPRNWKTSSACISTRRSTRWCCAPTRRAKFKPWIVPNPACR